MTQGDRDDLFAYDDRQFAQIEVFTPRQQAWYLEKERWDRDCWAESCRPATASTAAPVANRWDSESITSADDERASKSSWS